MIKFPIKTVITRKIGPVGKEKAFQERIHNFTKNSKKKNSTQSKAQRIICEWEKLIWMYRNSVVCGFLPSESPEAGKWWNVEKDEDRERFLEKKLREYASKLEDEDLELGNTWERARSLAESLDILSTGREEIAKYFRGKIFPADDDKIVALLARAIQADVDNDSELETFDVRVAEAFLRSMSLGCGQLTERPSDVDVKRSVPDLPSDGRDMYLMMGWKFVGSGHLWLRKKRVQPQIVFRIEGEEEWYRYKLGFYSSLTEGVLELHKLIYQNNNP